MTDADFFPDGRIIFAKATDLYVADRDGSNQRKLVSVAGEVWNPNVSRDGRRIVFGMSPGAGAARSLFESAADGTGLRTILKARENGRSCCARWTPDGKYLIYRAWRGGTSDLWALPIQERLFQPSREPVRLTAGPLSYSGAIPSRDGKQIFAIGTKRRGELVHYDVKSHEFVPFLSGISAIGPTFSKDGKWVSYTSYPDHTLWRSRSDGTERIQLTHPPMSVAYPFISPDGTRVVFTTTQNETYMVSMDGGPPQRVVEKNSIGANWSPDGNLLVFTSRTPTSADEKNSVYLQVVDLRTGKVSVVPSSQSVLGGWWITQDTIVAANEHFTKLVTFDFKTQKWSDLVAGNFVNWAVSPDYRYLYFTTGGPEPKAERIRFADHQIEAITSLINLRRVVDPVEKATQIDVAPDGSPVFTRDMGTQEIYALNVRWP